MYDCSKLRTGWKMPPGSLPGAARGAPYKAQLAACGGVPPYKWRRAGAFPRGMRLTKTGVVGGIPSKRLASGPHEVVVRVTDSKAHSASATLTLEIS